MGEIPVVMYSVDMDEVNHMVPKWSHHNLIGYTITIGVKMNSLAKPDHIVIGEDLLSMLTEKLKGTFTQLSSTPDWNYLRKTRGKIYSVYANLR